MALNPRDVARLLNDLRIKLPGSSDRGIKQELWSVLFEFFQDSRSWRGEQYFYVTAGTQNYAIAPEDGGQIIELFYVHDGNQFPAAAFLPDFNHIHIRWPVQQTTVVPSGPPPYPLSLTSPWKAGYLENIAEPATQGELPVAPSWVLRVYREHILDGVLGKMMSQKNKPYSDPNLAKYHLARFRAGIAIARTAAMRQNTFGAQNWRFPRNGTHLSSQRGGVSTAFPDRFL
jgi:hypothetical protein